MNENRLSSVEHVVVLMLENRSLDHMLGYLYAEQGNVSPAGQPFEGLTGAESNPDGNGNPVTVFKIEPATPNAYYMPGADPGEGYMATNSQLFGHITAPPSLAAPTMQGFVKDFAYTLGWQSREHGWTILPGTTAGNIQKPSPCFRRSPRATGSAITGSARLPPRRCRTELLRWRRPARVTWTTRPGRSPRPVNSISTSPGSASGYRPC